MKVRLLLSNKSSALNKKLIKFFKLNLLSLNKSSIIFDFEVAHPENMNKYIESGIKNYPVLINNNVSVTGVEKIIQYLKIHVKKHNDRIINKTDIETVDDFWKSEIKQPTDASGNSQDGDGGDGDDVDDLQKKIQNTLTSRSKSKKLEPGKSPNEARYNNLSSSRSSMSNTAVKSPAETMKSINTGNSQDDELMAKFFENQEDSLGGD